MFYNLKQGGNSVVIGNLNFFSPSASFTKHWLLYKVESEVESMTTHFWARIWTWWSKSGPPITALKRMWEVFSCLYGLKFLRPHAIVTFSHFGSFCYWLAWVKFLSLFLLMKGAYHSRHPFGSKSFQSEWKTVLGMGIWNHQGHCTTPLQHSAPLISDRKSSLALCAQKLSPKVTAYTLVELSCVQPTSTDSVENQNLTGLNSLPHLLHGWASKIENQGNPHIYWNDNNNHLPIPWDSKSYMSQWWWAIFNSETSPMPFTVKKNWERNWLLSTTKCVIRPDESLQWYQQRRLWKGQQGLVEQRSHCSREGNYKRWQ